MQTEAHCTDSKSEASAEPLIPVPPTTPPHAYTPLPPQKEPRSTGHRRQPALPSSQASVGTRDPYLPVARWGVGLLAVGGESAGALQHRLAGPGRLC